MFITELDTFVRKFHQLWNDGLTAHLDLDTHAGNAWVGLRVQLGQVPGPPHQQVQPFPQQVQRKDESPPRQRRRARRAAATAENKSNTEAVEAVVVEKENETTEVDEKVPDVVEVQEEIFDGKVSELAEEAIADRNVTEDLIDEVCSDEEYKLKNLARLNVGSTIPQVDGTFDAEVVYTFTSDFHKEDIEYTIKELIPEETKLVSVVRIGGLQSADQLCTLQIKIPPEKNFNWPLMTNIQSEVIKKVTAVPLYNPA